MLLLGTAVGSWVFPVTKTRTTTQLSTVIESETTAQSITVTRTIIEFTSPSSSSTSLTNPSFPLEVLTRPYVESLELSKNGGYGVVFNYTNISDENLSGIAYLTWNNSTNGQRISESVTDFYDVPPRQVFGLVFGIRVPGGGTWQLMLNTTNIEGTTLFPYQCLLSQTTRSGYFIV